MRTHYPSIAETFDRFGRGEGDGCWEWRGAVTKQQSGGGYGYGTLNRTVNGKRKHLVASRVSWELANGPIPDGMQVLHRCDNPPCVNPAHLFLGTQGDNMTDRKEKGRWQGGSPPGERAGKAKLKDADIPEIRRRYDAGEVIRQIAADYGVSHVPIIQIGKRRTWKHIAGPAPVPSVDGNERRRRGEAQHSAKLTAESVQMIREAVAAGQSMRSLAVQFGVLRHAIRDVISRRTWKHVP